MEKEIMIQVTDLRKSVENEAVLDGISFSFGEKGAHGILGPSGAGKSLLARVLAGVDEEYDGTVRIGERLLGSDALTWKKKIGYLPEESMMDPDMTVAEILEFIGRTKRISAEKREKQILEAMKLTGLSSLSRRLVANLSRGQLKKLGLAAMLLGNPDALILDEPLGGLSLEEREELCELIRMLSELKTLVLLSEDYDTVEQLCEDVVILSFGKVIASGSFEELGERLQYEEENVSLRELYMTLCTPVSAPTEEADGEVEEQEDAE